MKGVRESKAKKATEKAVRKQSYCTIGSYLSSANPANWRQDTSMAAALYTRIIVNFFRVLE
jgi:hypothetical protein